jgi:tRNA uridine 5-carboxymethylaminomethyl modification enzyme
MGCATLLITQDAAAIGRMSCNPAVGGIAKGHLVREIDALGGLMGRLTDACGIQFRMLNTRKGPAVRALRAQVDKHRYSEAAAAALAATPGLTVRAATVERLLVEHGRIAGVGLGVEADGETVRARAVVLTTGTFLKGRIHTGLESRPAGRLGEAPAERLSDSFAALGLEVGRLKTGTPPRLYRDSIDFSRLPEQWGDETPGRFSHGPEAPLLSQVACHLTWTNPRTHEIIRGGLDRSPMYSGRITGVGPRYCPSIEDKVVRFAERERHQVFLEPEGLSTDLYYVNGVSTSLPADVQEAFIHSIDGLEEAEIARHGYAVEYDYVPPIQLNASLEVRTVPGLFHAGQINGTSGYEEAAAQGLMAGMNAARAVRGEPPVVLGREQAYIGVLIDDLVTRGTREPYRMFTSRAEYRLLLRHDNADRRLMALGHELGLVDGAVFEEFCGRVAQAEQETRRLAATRIADLPGWRDRRHHPGAPDPGSTLNRYLSRPEVSYADLARIDPRAVRDIRVAEQVEVAVKYHGYIEKEEARIARQRKMEARRIPGDFDYATIVHLSAEVRERLCAVRPETVGQAARIPGVTPAAVSVLIVALERACPSRTIRH